MKDILRELSKNRFEDSNEITPESSFSIIQNYYDENPRHKYSEISNIIYNLEDEDIDILSINLKTLIELAKQKNNIDVINKLDKLVDHADLAHFQRKYTKDEISKRDKLIEGIYKNFILTREELLETRKKFKAETDKNANLLEQADETLENVKVELDSHKSQIYTQFVTILGIFTTIIFTAFGGLEMLRNILGNIDDADTEKLLVFSSLTLSGIIILLFILLSGISKLTRLNLRSCGCNSKDTKCEHNFAQKYPAFVLAQLVLFIIFLLGLTGYFIPYRTLFTEFITDKSVGVNSIIFGVLLFNLAVFASFYYFYKKQPKEKKHKNASNSKASQ